MKIKQCEECKYYKDIDFGNKHLLGSSWSGYCTYYPKTTRKQLRCIRSIVNCNKYDKEKNSLDKFVERYPTYIEALDMIDNLKEQLKKAQELLAKEMGNSNIVIDNLQKEMKTKLANQKKTTMKIK